MKISTNIRAGSGKAAGGGGGTATGGKANGGGADNPVGSEDPAAPAPVITYVPPVSRCVGL